MTVAEKMRELTNNSLKAQNEKNTKDHNAYVQHIINTKIRKRANDGWSNVKFKLKKHYSPTRVAETFANKGFDVIKASKNGKQYLTVSW